VNDHLAKEADRLRNDEIFNRALADIRSDALNALATINVDEKTMVLRLQQKVAVIDEIRSVLDRYIMAADVQEDAGSFA
jgi:hypothetical protein